MDQRIAYCGLECDKCPAYIAKRDNNQNLREKTAKEWSGDGFQVEEHQVNCNGCHSKEGLFFHCSNCSVRSCAIEKVYETCAECNDYPCTDKLEALWKMLNAPQAKDQLDKLQN